MNEVIFYTIGCPRCDILELKLKQHNINYKKVSEPNLMPDDIKTRAFPVLNVNGEYMDYMNSVLWVNKQ